MKSDYGSFRNRTFCDIFPDFETFLASYEENKLKLMTDVESVYYLLYAAYGNSVISSSDEKRFQYGIWSTMYMYGPTWERRMSVQAELRAMSIDQLVDGSKAIHNHAYNPSTAPSTGSTNELPYINEQNTTKYKKSKIEGYSILLQLLETDVTKEFIDKFKKLFLTIVQPEAPLWYVTNKENEVIEND